MSHIKRSILSNEPLFTPIFAHFHQLRPFRQFCHSHPFCQTGVIGEMGENGIIGKMSVIGEMGESGVIGEIGINWRKDLGHLLTSYIRIMHQSWDT